MKKIVLMLSILLAVCPSITAQKKKKQQQPPAQPEKKEVKLKYKNGLMNVAQDKENWFFQIADSLLGRPILTVTRYVSTPVSAGTYGGEMANSQVLYWEKVNDTKMILRSMMYDAVADPSDTIARAVRASNEDPIVGAFKIEATDKDKQGHKLYKLNVGGFFNSDNQVIGLSTGGKNTFGVTGLIGDRSYIKSIDTYPINTEVKTIKTYSSRPGNSLTAGQETGVVTLGLNVSFVVLPKEPMQARYFDSRVGYFTDAHTLYSDKQQQVKNMRPITRWRLEPKDEDIAKMRRGELVEPKKQIVYYIDPATPKQWRKYLIQGVEDWNVAFEQAGFKNAITAKEWPNDSTMSLEDARFSVIRYLASPISNAYGPQVHDPRSGEIIESHIGWYHNVMQLVHDWYMIQAGAVDERARKMKFDDDLMGELIRFVSSHEVGHTLGLRHNMGASSATPVDSLRDKAWVEKYGHTSSIMDYARFNYVAQPEDGISEKGIFPRINDYDKWAIRWGYSPMYNDYMPHDSEYKYQLMDPESERRALNKMVVEQLAKSRRYWFGGEGYDNDPLAQTEDLGNDNMKASDYGVMNLKRIGPKLADWIYEEGNLGDNLSQAYSSLTGQFNRYIGHVMNNIGGVYHNYKSVEQRGAVFTPVERDRQVRALEWLDKNVLNEPTWIISYPYIRRVTNDPQSITLQFGNRVVSKLFSPSTLRYICVNNTYKPDEYIRDIVGKVFKETSTGQAVTPYRIALQRSALSYTISALEMVKGSNGSISICTPYIYDMLMKIQQRLRSASPSDNTTKMHYQAMLQEIKLCLEGK